MVTSHRRSLILLLTACCLTWGLSPGSAQAENFPFTPEDYQPVEVEAVGPPELSGIPVLLATLFGAPPLWAYQEQVAPAPTPTVVVPVAPVVPSAPVVVNPGTPSAGTYASNLPGIQQTYDPWTPTLPEPFIATVNHTPEPGTLLSGAIGLGLVWMARRRARKEPEPAN